MMNDNFNDFSDIYMNYNNNQQSQLFGAESFNNPSSSSEYSYPSPNSVDTPLPNQQSSSSEVFNLRNESECNNNMNSSEPKLSHNEIQRDNHPMSQMLAQQSVPNLQSIPINLSQHSPVQHSYHSPVLQMSSQFFHERNRSEISELASPQMHASDNYYNSNAGSPVRYNFVEPLNLNDNGSSAGFDVNNFQFQHPMSSSGVSTDFSNFLNLGDIPEGSCMEKKSEMKSTMNLMGLGIEIPQQYKAKQHNGKEKKSGTAENTEDAGSMNATFQNDISFNINESFINEILKSDSNEESAGSDLPKDLMSEITEYVGSQEKNPGLLPAFPENDFKSKKNDFLNPNSLANLGSAKKNNNKRKSIIMNLEDNLDEGDTTIANNTSIMDLSENYGDQIEKKGSLDMQSNEPKPNTNNLVDELNSFSPTHSRQGSAVKGNSRFEMPKLKSFHHPKSPTLASPSRVTKFSNSNSFKAIPVLNEALSFVDDTSDLLSSPIRADMSPQHDSAAYFQNANMPPSPTRYHETHVNKQLYLQKGNGDGMGSYIPNVVQIYSSPNQVYYSNFTGPTPPDSPIKGGFVPTHSPSKSMPSMGNGMLNQKKSFVLKPTPNGRKRIATSPRSKTGCWTCRIRHKKCDEDRPVCKNCAKINLKCDQFYDPKPSYMTNEEEKKEKLAEIAEIWKNRSKKGNNKSNIAESDNSKSEVTGNDYLVNKENVIV